MYIKNITKKPIRILHILGGLDFGGAETLIMNIYNTIDRTKYQFDFLLHSNKKTYYTDEVIRLGGQIYSIPQYNVKNSLSYIKILKKFFKNHPEHDIVHIHSLGPSFLIIPIAKKENKFVIWHSHSNKGEGKNYMESFIKEKIRFLSRGKADVQLACSEYAGNWMFGKTKFHVLYNGICENKFLFKESVRNSMRKKLNIENNFVIGTVARITYLKNPFFILKIFEEVLRQNLNARLLWIGSGDLEIKLREKIKKEKLCNKILIIKNQSNVQDYLMAMDSFLLPSLSEGLGIALIEAQAMGLYCVASDLVPKEADISNNVDFLSLNLPINFFAKKILSPTNINREEANKLIANGKYSINNTTKELIKIYERKSAVS